MATLQDSGLCDFLPLMRDRQTIRQTKDRGSKRKKERTNEKDYILYVYNLLSTLACDFSMKTRFIFHLTLLNGEVKLEIKILSLKNATHYYKDRIF